MRALQFSGEGRASVIEREAPRPAPGEVLLQICRTALCGSDITMPAAGARRAWAGTARDQALHIVAPHGVVLWVGESDDPWLVHETQAVRRKHFFLVRSCYFPKSEHDEHIGLIRRHRAACRRLVDHRFDLAELPAEFERFVRGERIKPLMTA